MTRPNKGKFVPGRSGNPKGRPKGIEDRRVALRALLEPHAPRLVEKAVQKALKGDIGALRLCLDRLIPPVKARNEPVSLPLGGTLAEKGNAVLDAAARGELSPDELSMLMQAISAQAHIVKVDELERRVTELEERKNGKS
jgi:Family of unknown function (DUF5681)